MSVDAAEVTWLKEGRQYAAAANTAVQARWGAAAVETDILSPLALLPGAVAEAARQAGFLGGPLAIEKHDVPGERVDLMLTVQTITAPGLGYGAGIDVFVIEAEEREDVERTTLTVLRRL